MQLFPYQLPTTTFNAGSRSNLNLRDLPKMLGGKHFHLVKLQFSIQLAPTFGSGTVPLVGEHNMFSIDFNDGNGVSRFVGSLNAMRAKERLQNGRLRVPDPDEGATTVVRHFERTLHIGPPQMKGAPSDFVIPCGALENGQLNITHGTLAQMGSTTSNVSACTGTLKVTAWLLPLPEIRIPPCYQFQQQDTTSSDVTLTGRNRYELIALLNSSSFDAITAGDFGAARLDMGQGDVIPNIDVEELTAGFNDDFAVGEFGGVLGEPETATVDDNMKIVDRSSPLAIVAQAADLQPILWTSPGGKLTKLYQAESVCKLRWNGTQQTATILYGRFLEQTPNVITSLIAKSAKAAGVTPLTWGLKTVSKKPMLAPGDHAAYMPWKVTTT
jgi:hypothetical protein